MIACPRFPAIRLCRLALYRTFVSTSWRKRSRDVMAKYRRPLPSALPDFETSSTVPAAASFQDVPPPDTKVGSSRKAIPIPPMRPMVEAWEVQSPREEKDKEMIVLGIVIPPKPRPPKDDECCMNSCVNCVYNLYADDLEAYTTALDEAHTALKEAGTAKIEWPEAVRALDAKSNGKEGVKTEEEAKAMEGVDPVTLAFLEMEKKLRKKQKAKGI